MLSLAKAVIVANEPDTLLDNIKSHGLGRDRSNTSTKMENQTAATSQGVFAHLSNVVQGFAYPKGAVIRIKDVFSISPELAQMYERYFDEPPRSVYSYGTKALSNNPFRLEVRTAGPDPQRVYRRIPELAVDFDLQPHPGVAGDLAFQSKDHVKESPGYFGLYDAVVAGNFLVGALPFLWNGVPTKRYLSPPLGDYIAMFILSNCVRYKQDLWGEVVQGRETGILGLIDLFLEVSKRRFPNFILDHLFGEHFGYGTPARILGPPR
jgi:hypothetical protein